MRIRLAIVHVDDQRLAETFYTEVLGFVKKHDIALGEFAWLTIVAPDEPDGAELLLEPSDHRAVNPYREALVADGIPAVQFAVDDLRSEYERLVGLGVRFTMEPTDVGGALVAILDDTCGNLVQLAQEL